LGGEGQNARKIGRHGWFGSTQRESGDPWQLASISGFFAVPSLRRAQLIK
jgi:hypothetical protein